MKITQVDLENFKSYQNSSISFMPGTNAISGKNGAGKSSILEAIGFAVFGYAPYTHEQLVREGKNTASVTVHLTGNDGRSYEVVRKCGSSSKHYAYDPELDEKMVSGVGDTLDWLRDFMGVNEGTDLSALFRDAVGVQQGRLTSVFLEPASQRKDTFNPLLGVDEYEEIWNMLLEPKRFLEEQIQSKETLIARFKGEVKRLPSLQKQENKLEEEISEEEQSKKEAEEKLSEVKNEKQRLESQKEKIQSLRAKVNSANSDVENSELRLKDALEAVREAERAQEIAEKTEDSYIAYKEAQESLAVLEDRRNERDAVKDELNQHKNELNVVAEKIKHTKKQLGKISAAEEKLEELKPKVELQKNLEEKLEEANQNKSRFEEIQGNIHEAKRELERLNKKLNAIEESLAEKKEKETNLAQLKKERESLNEQRENLTSTIAGKRATRKEQITKIEALEIGETAKCPVCEEPLTPEHRDELLERFTRKIKEFDKDLENLERKQDAIESALEDIDNQIEEIENQIKTLPRQEEADDLQKQTDKKTDAVSEMSEKLNELEEAPSKVNRLEQQLKELGDPQTKHITTSANVEDRDTVEQELEKLKAEKNTLAENVKGAKEGLEEFAGIDQKLSSERDVLEENQQGHQRHLEHDSLAKKLPEREERADELENQVDEAQRELNRVTQEYEEAKEKYDAEEYQKLVDTLNQLQEEVTTLEERLRNKNELLDEAQEEIQELLEVKRKKQEAADEKESLEDTLRLLSFFRRLLRDAGPEITRRLVDLISLEADRFYSDMMQDYKSRLKWTDDYNVVLQTDGRKREFPQLSGGEGMAAALAIRLALLREVTGIDVAFFDEPTANLDDLRRDNLSEQIMDVKGFSQLFVISHDDTFEQDTDHIVRVTKENDISQVEV